MRLIIYISIVCAFIGCHAEVNRGEEPEDLIPKERMIIIMKEMIKLEAIVQQKYQNVANYYQVMLNSGDSLLKTYQVTRKQYESSMNYYSARQDVLIQMNDEINDQLTKERVELRKKN